MKKLHELNSIKDLIGVKRKIIANLFIEARDLLDSQPIQLQYLVTDSIIECESNYNDLFLSIIEATIIFNKKLIQKYERYSNLNEPN